MYTPTRPLGFMAVASFPPSPVPERSDPSGYSNSYYDLKEEFELLNNLEKLQDNFSRLRDSISNDQDTDTFRKRINIVSLFKHAQEKFQEKVNGILSHIKGRVAKPNSNHPLATDRKSYSYTSERKKNYAK